MAGWKLPLSTDSAKRPYGRSLASTVPILIYIYSLLQALPGDRRYPDPLISQKPLLMVRLWIADNPDKERMVSVVEFFSVSLTCRVWDAAQ